MNDSAEKKIQDILKKTYADGYIDGMKAGGSPNRPMVKSTGKQAPKIVCPHCLNELFTMEDLFEGKTVCAHCKGEIELMQEERK